MLGRADPLALPIAPDALAADEFCDRLTLARSSISNRLKESRIPK